MIDPESQDLPSSSAKSCSTTAANNTFPNFSLSAIIEAHQPNDAKCVAEIDGVGLVTGGRDGIMKIWKNMWVLSESRKFFLIKKELIICNRNYESGIKWRFKEK